MQALTRSRSTLAVLLLALSLSACASKNQTGNNKVLDFKDTVQHRLGEATATPSVNARVHTARPVAAPTVKAVPRQTQAPTPQHTQAAPAFVISINSDTSSAGSQFTPSLARVFAGQVITWTNKDNVARSVVADKGAFNSGPIAPGKSYTF